MNIINTFARIVSRIFSRDHELREALLTPHSRPVVDDHRRRPPSMACSRAGRWPRAMIWSRSVLQTSLQASLWVLNRVLSLSPSLFDPNLLPYSILKIHSSSCCISYYILFTHFCLETIVFKWKHIQQHISFHCSHNSIPLQINTK
jgi:hypothetical protein